MGFRNISAWAIRNPVPPIVLFLALSIAGIVSFLRMDVNNDPDIDFPIVWVSISQPGAAPSELENRLKRAVIMADGKLITAEDLDLAAPEADALPVNLKAAREAADRQVIRKALAQTDGNISGAAKLLGISRPTLYDLLKQYGLQP